MADPLLSVRDLRVRFDGDDGTVRAVDGVDFDVAPGETVCLVGESGSGKTVACESITRLLPTGLADISGEVRFDGTDLTDLSESALESYRGGRIGHVFQNPQDALDPVYTVGAQVVEAIRIHREVSKSEARAEAIDLLDRVGIGDAAARFDDYPHQFSGGMKQRAVVAMALACDPDLLIADEPTTALDVTIQRQVLDLLADLQAERGMALLFVTHDLGVVAEIADRVVVMYAGNVMETGDVYDVFEAPAHPYTRALLACLPGRGERFETIGGSIPDPTDPPAGCRFHPRCSHAVPECEEGDQPAFRSVESNDAEPDSSGSATPADHQASCVLYDDGHALPPELEVADD
ncbi:ABC transporter ATP-binding protein [Halosimplex sp. J119]